VDWCHFWQFGCLGGDLCGMAKENAIALFVHVKSFIG